MGRRTRIRKKLGRRVCAGCGEVFQPKRKGHLYHEPRCRNLSWRVKHRTIRLTASALNDHETRIRAIEKRLRIAKGD